MSQLGISNVNPNTEMNVSNISDDNDLESIIDAGFKKNIENETSMEKMEKLGGPKPPKPESTMHKVGRYLTGILGGLLLAAGVAAAVAATVASFGLAAGVVATAAAAVVGAVGVTGASVAAGVAGAAGIGFIAGSAAMKPKEPEALLQQEPREMQTVNLTEFGAEETDTIKNALKAKYDAEPALIQSDSNVGEKIGKLVESIEGEPVYEVDKSLAKPDDIKSCVKGILSENGIQKLEVNEKNMLLVRHAIDTYLGESDDGDVYAWNLAEVKNGFNTIAEDAMKKLSPNSEDYKLLDIFKGALNLKSVDIPKPQQNPVIQGGIDENLITNEPKIKTVSMQQKVQSLPTSVKWGREEDSKLLQAIKSLDPNLEPERTTEDNNDFELLLENLETKDDGTVTDMDTSLLSKYVNGILEHNGIKNIELNAKNILLVRHNINSFLLEKGSDYQNVVKALDSVKGRQKYVDYLQGRLNKEKDAKTCAAIHVFIAAISENNLANLNPLPPQDIMA